MKQKTRTNLENIRNIPEIVNVVKLHGGGKEPLRDLSMKEDGCLHELWRESLHVCVEGVVGEMLREEGSVDGLHGFLAR